MKIHRQAFFWVFALSILKLGIHLWSGQNYGFQRDELLHIACGEYLDWGYMEFPPWIAWMAAFSRFFFGHSVLAIRILPALIGFALVWIAAAMARELKGGPFAQVLAAASILTATAYYRNHTLFQPVVFDQFFWTLGYFFLLKYLNTQKPYYLILLGIDAGFGLLNKYTMLFWGGGMVISLIFVAERRLFRSYYLWMAGGIALFIFSPNILWQYSQGFPVLGHFSGLYTDHLQDYSRWAFFMHQIDAMHPYTFPIWGVGIFFLILAPSMRTYRIFGFIYLFTIALFLLAKGKSYYLFAIYPIYYAAGGVAWETLLNKWSRTIPKIIIQSLVIIFLLVDGMLSMPYGTPFLPIEDFVAYAQIPRNKEGRLEGLTGDYADMFGWEEQVALVDSLYHSLDAKEQKSCILWAENYGEAGAIQVLGRKYNLPYPTCSHGSFYLWGVGLAKPEVAITVGLESEQYLKRFYKEVKLAKIIRHPYAIEEEHNIPVYVCKGFKKSLQKEWPKYRKYVFN